MQVKVFEATDMASGLKMIKETFGPDALILSTKTVRKGKMGILGKPVLEITAAIDKPWAESKNSRPASSRPVANRSASVTGQPQEDDLSYETLWKQESPVEERAAGRQERSTRPERQSGEQDIRDELGELRSMISSLASQISGMESPAALTPGHGPHLSGSTLSPEHPAMRILADRGVAPAAARTIAEYAGQALEDGTLEGRDLEQFLCDTIADLFQVNRILTERLNEQKRIALIGPTGVGKTTTIAKIAANYISSYGPNIALITIDTYRIAAVEQLKVYGEIMQLPVEVVIRPDELEQALEKHRRRDLVLIDTAGRSPRSDQDLEELASFLRPHLGIENHLVLAANTREEELTEIIHRFSRLTVNNLIFSKLDECGLLGVLLNMHIQNGTPISFLTNGQRVPEDIITPDRRTIAGLIMDQHRTKHHG